MRRRSAAHGWKLILLSSMFVLAGSHAGCGPDDSPSPMPGPTPAPSPAPNPEPPPSLPQPFRHLAARCGVKVGPAVAYSPLVGEPAYGDTLGREFNILTPENDMKWGFIHPQRSQYSFDRADAIVAFAASNDMVVHGHTLVWHNENPSWLTSNSFSRDEMIDILRDHITTVVGRFAGRYLTAWDVVNEGVNDDGSLRRTLWLDRIGTDYMDLAFRYANQTDPAARLIYNDYGNETINAKSDGIYTLLSGMRSRGVPVHGIGMQMHLPIGGIDLTSVAQNMQRFAALGLEIYITETDVRVPTPATSAALATQADVYRGVLNACLGQPACKSFQMWGFTDRYSWIPGSFPGQGAALIFDERYQPKPAYDALELAMSRCVPR